MVKMTSANAPRAQVFWSFFRPSSVLNFHEFLVSLWFSAVITDPVRPIESQHLRPLFPTVVSLTLNQIRSFCTFSSATCSNIWALVFLLRSDAPINKVGGKSELDLWMLCWSQYSHFGTHSWLYLVEMGFVEHESTRNWTADWTRDRSRK